jgi:hypothetical protein
MKKAVVGLGAAAVLVGVMPTLAGAALATSTEYGGFEVALDGAPSTTVQATFTVPTVTCTKSLAVEQATVRIVGSNGVVVGAEIYSVCKSGTPDYRADANGMFRTVSAGDKVTLSASFVAASGTAGQSATVKDITTGMSVTNSGGAAVKRAKTAFVGVEYDSEPIPDFHSLAWTGSTLDGKGLSTAEPTGFELVRSSKTLVTTSALSTAGAFTNTWVAAG